MLYIVRHGRTTVNAEGRLLGRLDPPLDPTGAAQAAAAAARLGNGIVRVVSSPLLRARATAEGIAAVSGIAVEIDERWIELDYGELDGARMSELDPGLWAAWRADISFAPPGGESLAALGARVRAACDDLLEDAAAGDVAVVTHVSPVKAAVAWALGVPDEVTWRLYVAPGSVTTIGVVGGGATVLRSFNEAPSA